MPHPHTVVTPEEREFERKEAELKTLENELVERELECTTLQNELRAFEAQYFRTVGTLYAELDELEAQIVEAQARWHPQEASFRERANRARAQATESGHAVNALVTEAPKDRFAPTEALRSLYREIARQIHPDLATEEANRTRRNRLMAKANEAYADGDEATLRAILEDWYSSPEMVEGIGIGSELVRIIRKIHQVNRRLEELHAATTNLRQLAMHRLLDDVKTAATQHRDLLAEMAEQLKREIAGARARLAVCHQPYD